MAAKKIYLIAGEASGDLHGANLIRYLRSRSSHPLEIYGVGGDKIQASGVRDFFDLAHFHVTGLTAAFKALPKYKRASLTIFSNIEKARPDLVVLIDNPGFNLHLAKKIHALGIPIVYFIAPQVWAWAPKRVLKIKKYVKKVLVVFEFEKKFFESHQVPVAWVGHPLKDLVESEIESFKERPARERKECPIVLLPGSRKGELKMLFPVFLKAAKLISEKIPNATFSVIQSPTMPASVYEEKIKSASIPIRIVKKNAYEAIASSRLAIVCSGTATLECALLRTPMIISNRGSFVTYVVAKNVIRVNCLGLPNLILGEKVFPEFLQYDATPEKIASTALQILGDEKIYASMKKACEETSQRIGESGASQRAADEILALLN